MILYGIGFVQKWDVPQTATDFAWSNWPYVETHLRIRVADVPMISKGFRRGQPLAWYAWE